MISVMLYSPNEDELNRIRYQYREVAVGLSDDDWDICAETNDTRLYSAVEKTDTIDFACIDVTSVCGIKLAERIRKKSDFCSIVLISDKNISPVLYIKPTIRASSLLLRPLTDKQIHDTLFEVADEYFRAYLEKDSDSSFIMENRDGRRKIPYSQIFYFETRKKKISVNTGMNELDFYDTLDNLESILPENFIRCHRSFIVSGSKIASVKLSNNTICLINGSTVPVSRTYKSALRELMK